ncbi:MAG: hypothetical protein EXR29_06955 [Betaproteobacteria bacterium]|nr:hypothetical protein [Betaproteobacteria bacterium]
MKRVATLVNHGEYGQALVRLWVLSGQRESNDLVLNGWEGARDAAAHPGQVKAFRSALEKGQPPTAAQIATAPLAFVEALDQENRLLHRRHPWSETPFEEEGAGYWLVPVELARRQEVPLARQPGDREKWFKCHSVIPVRTSNGIEVVASSATGRLAQAMAEIVKGDEVTLTVWIGHFNDAALLESEVSPAKRRRFRRIQPAEVRNASIFDTLEPAAAAGAHAVVLPELTVDLEARKLIATWLIRNPEHPFELVVAGSFHEETADGWFNTAELWNRHAESLISHRKLRLYGDADGFAEDVNAGGRISVFVTAAGSFSLLICKDFLDEHASVATLLQEVPVDWVLVPSYGDEGTVKRHAERALKLAKVGPGTCSVIANQRNIEAGEGDPCPGFAQPRSAENRLNIGVRGGAVSLAGDLALIAISEDKPPKPSLRRVK